MTHKWLPSSAKTETPRAQQVRHKGGPLQTGPRNWLTADMSLIFSVDCLNYSCTSVRICGGKTRDFVEIITWLSIRSDLLLRYFTL